MNNITTISNSNNRIYLCISLRNSNNTYPNKLKTYTYNIAEEWRDVTGYEGEYKVSNTGKVLSLKYKIEKYINQLNDKDGYKIVKLFKNSICKYLRVHRLVAEAFIPNKENYNFVDHINNIRTDNFYMNLRWVTRRENAQNLLAKKEGNCISNYYGIYFNKSKKYCAQIFIKGKKMYIGSYINEEDAARAYDLTLIENNLNPVNFPLDHYTKNK